MSDNFNLKNSVWPNGLKRDEEGYVTFYPLGTNKVDISTIDWPEGDTLITPFVYKNDILVGFVDTKALTVSGSATTTMNYNHIEADFSSIVEGTLTVDAPNAVVKKFSWSVVDSGDDNGIVTLKYKGCKTVDDVKAVDPDYLTNDIIDGVWTEGLGDLEDGDSMFRNCSKLNSFNSDLSSLTSGDDMFYGCSRLTTFSSDLSSLTDGTRVFQSCKNLTSFNSDLSNLTNSSYMFQSCTNLTSFTSDLSKLTIGLSMFTGCSNLTSFNSDLFNLTNGRSMLNNCVALTSFNSDLSNLTYGASMFNSCKLDAESVMYIADTIKDITAEKQLYIDGTIPYVTLSNGVYSATRGFMSDGKYVYTYNNPKPFTTTISASYVGSLTLGINVVNNADTIQQQLEDFAKAATFETWADLKKHFTDKGWTVTFQYGGTTTSITYDIRNREQIISCPIFAKLVEADKDSAEYCTEDASTFYNIDWGHDVTDTSSYTQFNSLEDAMTSWNVFPKENIITSEE